jgi:putative flavoprotein involved in K+ transport
MDRYANVESLGQDALTREVQEWLRRFAAALSEDDVTGAMSLFDDDCYWRDAISFTWNLKTFEGTQSIGRMLESVLPQIRPRHWSLDETPTETGGVVQAFLRFETETARGRAIVRLKNGRCCTLFTTIEELIGHEEVTGRRRPIGATHRAQRGKRSWLARREQEKRELGYEVQPYVLIVGGGQGGISLGTALKRLGVPTLIVDRYQKPGDAWRNRYEQLTLHDGVWYNPMPYMPYPDDWPTFASKDQMGDFLEAYTQIMQLNFWGDTDFVSGQFDEDVDEWVVQVERDGRQIELRPTQLVFANGVYGTASIPETKGLDTFEGEWLHTSQYFNGEPFRGKNCVVVGASNSAHDVCQDLWENEAGSVTMLQRTSTLIVNSHELMKFLAPLYSEDALEKGIDAERADLLRASTPLRVLTETHRRYWAELREREADFYGRLESVGFKLDFAEDGAGLAVKALRRGTGWYVNEGASDLIISGDIKVQHAGIAEVSGDKVVLEDGTELPTDVIVFATGYESISQSIAKLLSPEVAQKVGPCWGVGSGLDRDPGPWEGELRAFWKPTGQKNFWVHGGGLASVRPNSKLLALQLKARMEKIDTPVYG